MDGFPTDASAVPPERARALAAWPEDLRLADGDVVLRRWRLSDAPAVTAACRDPDIPRWIPVIPAPYAETDAIEFLREVDDEWRIGSSHAFAIVDAADRLLGAVTLHGPEGHLAEIGYWLAAEARGRGVATRAVRLLAAYSFRADPALVRIGLRTLVGNDASGRVAERAGFSREGVLRAAEPVRGVPTDVVVYSLLRTDPVPR
jgi:RimJ/RimL family protein N-acetyltransferase